MRSMTAQVALVMLAMPGSAFAQTPATSDRKSKEETPFDPAHYVKIYEETSDRRILLYDPRHVATAPTLLRVDADSKIVVELNFQSPGQGDMALNGLFMSAELSRVDPGTGPVKAEVLNVSEIAADPKTQASQAGVALRTAGDVRVILQNLYE